MRRACLGTTVYHRKTKWGKRFVVKEQTAGKMMVDGEASGEVLGDSEEILFSGKAAVRLMRIQRGKIGEIFFVREVPSRLLPL